MQRSIDLHFNESINQNPLVYNTFFHSGLNQDTIRLLETLYRDQQRLPQSSPIDKIKELAQLTDDQLLYLLVEIRLMVIEKGPFAFNKREKGCIKAFFKALATGFENLKNISITESLIKQLHQISTDIQSVTMEQITNENSGKYRSKTTEETLTLSTDYISEAGILQLIEQIEKGEFPHMIIAGENDYHGRYLFNPERHSFAMIAYLLKNRDKIDTINSEAVLESMNDLIDEKFILEYFLTESELIQVFKEVKFIENFYPNKINQQISLWDIADFIKEDSEKHIITMQKYLTSQSSLQFFKLPKSAPELKISSTTLTTIKKYYQVDNLGLAKLLINSLKQHHDIFVIQFPSSVYVEELMHKALESFNNKIAQLQSLNNDDKLYVIFEHIQKLLLIHPFVDANNRVFVNELGNALLLQHGFNIGVYFNPLVFYAHSTKEIVTAVKLAQANYLLLQAINRGEIQMDLQIFKSVRSKDKFRVHDFVQPFRLYVQKLAILEQLQDFSSRLTATTNHLLFKKVNAKQAEIGIDMMQVKILPSAEDINAYLYNRIKLYKKTALTDLAEEYTKLFFISTEGEPANRMK